MARVSFPSCQHCVWCHTLLLGEVSAAHISSLGEDNWKLISGLSWTLSYESFLLADFDQNPFIVINCNCNRNDFSDFRESF